MSTKYPWLPAALFRKEDRPSNTPALLTRIEKSAAFRLLTQRVAIPTGWTTLVSHFKPTSGILVHVSLLLVVIVTASMATTANVFAAITITEVFPAPESGQNEWVELYNDGGLVSLQDWQLRDTLATPSIIMTLQGVAIPGSYHHYSWPTNKLNNAGDTVTLYDPVLQVVDSFTYETSQTGKSWSLVGAPPNQTWQLTDPTPGEANPSPLPSPNPTVTPIASPSPSPSTIPLPEPCTEASPTPSPSGTPATSPSPSPSASPQTTQTAGPYDIYISAVMACPEENQQEWVEVFNATSQPLTTDGWHITDAAANKRYLLQNSAAVTVPANTFTTISFASTFINNSSETLFLHAADDQIVQTIDLPSCETKGIAFTQSGGSWVQGSTEQTASTNQTTPESSPTPATIITQETTPAPQPTPKITAAQTQKPAVLGLQTKFGEQKPHLAIASEITSTFKKPLALLKPDQKESPVQAIIALIIGGTLLITSSGSKLLELLPQRVL